MSESQFNLNGSPTGRQFILHLAASQLLPPKSIDSYLNKFYEELGNNCEDFGAEEIAKFFVCRKALTKWQADKLLNGQYRGFFYDQYKLVECRGHVADGSNYLVIDTSTNNLFIMHVRPPSLNRNQLPEYTFTALPMSNS